MRESFCVTFVTCLEKYFFQQKIVIIQFSLINFNISWLAAFGSSLPAANDTCKNFFFNLGKNASNASFVSFFSSVVCYLFWSEVTICHVTSCGHVTRNLHKYIFSCGNEIFFNVLQPIINIEWASELKVSCLRKWSSFVGNWKIIWIVDSALAQ